jgi:thymidylate synthase (FAD)
VVEAARVSISGLGTRPVSDDKKLLTYLHKHRHTSPFEKVRFEFDCKMPIFVARQWVRHRNGSFNEVSARYSELPQEFYVPELERMQAQATTNKQGSAEPLALDAAHECRARIKVASERAYAAYRSMLNVGLARETARMVLPTNIYTHWWWTVDLHNLMHFLRLRLDSHAQYEIRVYAQALLDEARHVAPFTFKLFEDSLCSI